MKITGGEKAPPDGEMAMAHWTSKLTKKEIQHLLDFGISSCEDLKKTRAIQIEHMKRNPECVEPCWDCRTIAHKLGLE